MSLARGGRLTAIAEAMQQLNTSVAVDRALYREDIAGSIAHARGLARAHIVSDDEAAELVRGLEQVQGEIERGEFVWNPEKEDVHMNIEARLREIVGPVGGKLHTARSRNDQIATDLRLWARARGQEVMTATAELANAIVTQAADHLDVLMPAYTHLQRGQPSRLAHHLMAWQELLARDHGRVADAVERMNECPLGAGAAAGSGYPLDRAGVAAELGFREPMRNSLDATASRDFLMELASALAILCVHLSRIGEELVLWSTTEFGFLRLSDAFSTSSSMMPQKKNPDVAELVRGKAARAMGAVTTLLALEKSLPFGYGRDLQEDKLPIFDAVEATLLSLRALTGAVATATFDRARLEGALTTGHLCATDLADYLVLKGMPFRDAHHLVGGLVRVAAERELDLSELDDATLEAAHPALSGAGVRAALDPHSAVERRALLGGPARARVAEAIAEARRRWTAAP